MLVNCYSRHVKNRAAITLVWQVETSHKINDLLQCI